jgi:hypothetical protein
MADEKPDDFSKHEVLHTAYLASDFFDRHLLEHVAVVSSRELKKAAAEVSDKLADFYQLCGRELI